MTWFKADDKLTFHEKTVTAGNAAMGAWIRIGAWCAERESDGFIPRAVANLIGSEDEISALVAVGFLHSLPDGRLEMHDYLKYNPSKAQLTAQRAEWAARRGQDRRKASRSVSHSDTRECLSERPAETPGTGSGTLSGSDPDPDRDPDGDSHRAEPDPETTAIRRISSRPPPPESVEPEEPPAAESGYDLAKRVFGELWREKYRRSYPVDFVDQRPSGDMRVLQRFGAIALERGPRAEEYARHCVKAYLRAKGDKDWLVEHAHPARCLLRDIASYGEPKPEAASVKRIRTAEPVAPALSPAEVAAKLAAAGMGKIGMGGRT